VLRPLRVVIDNYPEGQVEELEAINSPEDPGMGTRKVPFSRVLYLEREDFRGRPAQEVVPSRSRPGGPPPLRLLHHCTDVIKDPKTGEVVELRCTYDPATRGGSSPDGRKVQGTLHWVSAGHAIEAEARLYEHLLSVADPSEQARMPTSGPS